MAARELLKSSSDLQLVGEASSGEEAPRVVAAARADVVLLDVDMPVMDGAATATALKGLFPQLTVIAWTVSDLSDDLLRMLKAGCAGYVLKDAGPSELHRALMAALRNESPLPRRMIPEALRKAAENAPIRSHAPASLTAREMEMLRGIAKGYTTKRLAQETKLAVPSVETHLRNLFRKLDAGNRGEAVSAALRQGLITLADL
jgi:DNA-binding NarL/FixJ family response regulator